MGEQPLPPNGACLLGSFNLSKYIVVDGSRRSFNFKGFASDIPHAIRAMDNVTDRTSYPLEEQREEAISKRRMGIGITGTANAIEACGKPYGSPAYIRMQDKILRMLRDISYMTSIELAKEKGSIAKKYIDSVITSWMFSKLPLDIQKGIKKHGLRNSHLLSIAPTGTISLVADNVSSGIEPVFKPRTERDVMTSRGKVKEVIEDYGLRVWGVTPRDSSQCSVDDHVNVLLSASKWVDSAVSKTCNIGEDVSFEDFKEVYLKAYRGGAKGCTTFREAGKRMGIMKEAPEEGAACYIDPETNIRSCE